MPQEVDSPTNHPWLDETKISNTSQPYFYVEIFGIPIENKRPFLYKLDRTQIVEASIEGKAPKARRGSFRFVDPDGIWPDILANAGAYSNSIEGKGKPNLRVHFGWQNLTKDKTTQEIMTELSGLILKTKFSIDPETAMTTIEIEYIEAMMSWFQNLRFLDLNDMIILDSEEIKNKIKEMSVSELLTHIWDKSSIKADLEKSDTEIVVNFNNTGSDKKIDGRKFKIRFGDSLGEKINEITAQAVHEVDGESGKPDVAWSYERIKKSDELIVSKANDKGFVELKYSGTIEYDWLPAPMGESDEDTNIANTFSKSDIELTDGPDLLWKSQKSDSESKMMLTWDSDLNSKEYLIHQARDELTQKLSQYTEGDWDTMQRYVKHLNEKGLNPQDEDDPTVRAASQASLEADIEKRSDRGRFGLWWGRLTGGVVGDIAGNEERMQLVETLFNEAELTAGNPESQMAAIIANNVFQGQATILGDPNFGTILLPYQTKMTMVFEDVGEFATLFQRDWLLTDVVHRFSEGSYVTEIKLLTYPEQNQSVKAIVANIDTRRSIEVQGL